MGDVVSSEPVLRGRVGHRHRRSRADLVVWPSASLGIGVARHLSQGRTNSEQTRLARGGARESHCACCRTDARSEAPDATRSRADPCRAQVLADAPGRTRHIDPLASERRCSGALRDPRSQGGRRRPDNECGQNAPTCGRACHKGLRRWRIIIILLRQIGRATVGEATLQPAPLQYSSNSGSL
jgi:hypothetical protein